MFQCLQYDTSNTHNIMLHSI